MTSRSKYSTFQDKILLYNKSVVCIVRKAGDEVVVNEESFTSTCSGIDGVKTVFD